MSKEGIKQDHRRFASNSINNAQERNSMNTLIKQSRTVSNSSVTFPTLPQIVAWTDGYMAYSKIRTAMIRVTSPSKNNENSRRRKMDTSWIENLHPLTVYVTNSSHKLTPFSLTVRLMSSSRMCVIFTFCGSSAGYLKNL